MLVATHGDDDAGSEGRRRGVAKGKQDGGVDVSGDGMGEGKVCKRSHRTIEERWRGAIGRWVSRLMLADWTVFTKIGEMGEDRLAETLITHPYHRATCVLSHRWATESALDGSVTGLEEIAAHEVMHIFMADLTYTLEDIIDQETTYINRDVGRAVIRHYNTTMEALVDEMAHRLIEAYESEEK